MATFNEPIGVGNLIAAVHPQFADMDGDGAWAAYAALKPPTRRRIGGLALDYLAQLRADAHSDDAGIRQAAEDAIDKLGQA